MERVFTNLEHYGNTSAASIPLALVDAVNAGKLSVNDKIIMIGFGAGLTWAAAAVTWGQPRTITRNQHRLQQVRYGVAGIRSRIRRRIRAAGDRIWGTAEK
jgi:3-hydroxy-3-methylglutaryl CoA synthase